MPPTEVKAGAILPLTQGDKTRHTTDIDLQPILDPSNHRLARQPMAPLNLADYLDQSSKSSHST